MFPKPEPCPRCGRRSVFRDPDPDAFLTRCDRCGVLALAPLAACPPGWALDAPPPRDAHDPYRETARRGRLAITCEGALRVTVDDDALAIADGVQLAASAVDNLCVIAPAQLVVLDHEGRITPLVSAASYEVARWLELVIERHLGRRDRAISGEVAP